MSRTIDSKVVEMEFDNKNFEQNVNQSMTTLEKLQAKLDSLGESGKGLDGLTKAAKSFSLDDVGSSVERLEKKFSAMGIAGMTVMSELTKSALNLGKTIIGKVVEPITTGGWNRASNIAKAQFMIEGLGKDWQKVNAAADFAVKGTAYGFDEAAKAASSLAASGVRLDDTLKEVYDSASETTVQMSSMHQALRGISGVAAMTDSSYSEIASIFTTVAGQGKLMTMQLRQLESKGLNVAATLGKQLGKSEAEIRDMVQKGKISFNEFSAAMDDAFGEHAKDADRTFSGVTKNIRAALARIGQKFYTPIFEQDGPVVQFLQKVKAVLNDVNKALDPLAAKWTNLVRNMAKMGQTFLEGVRAEGVAQTIENISSGILNLAKAIASVVAPIRAAFKEVFGGTVIGNLNNLSAAFKTFTEALIMNSDRMGNIRDAFKGVFNILKLLGDAFTEVARAILPFVTETDGLIDVVLKIAGFIGRVLSAFSKWVADTKIVTKVLTGLRIAIGVVLMAIGGLITGIATLISKFRELSIIQNIGNMLNNLKSLGQTVFSSLVAGVLSFIQAIRDSIKTFTGAKTEVSSFGQKFAEIFNGLINKVKELFTTLTHGGFGEFIHGLVEAFSNLKKQIADTLSKDEISWFDVLVMAIKNLLTNLSQLINVFLEFVTAIDWGRVAAIGFVAMMGILAWNTNRMINSFTKVSGAAAKFFELLSGKLTGIQKFKPSVLEDLAIVIATLALSLKLLATVPVEQLDAVTSSMLKLISTVGAMSMLVAIVGAIAKKKGGLSDFAAMGLTMAAMAGSVALLAIALKTLGEVDLEDVRNKVILVSGIAISLGVSVGIMAKLAPKLSVGALTLMAFGYAVNKIIEALVNLQDVDLTAIKGSLVQFAALMGGLALLAAGVGRIGLGTAAMILGFVLAWKIIGDEIVAAISSISFEDLAPKLESLLASLAIVTGVIIAMDVLLKKFGGGLKNLGLGMAALAVGMAILTKIATIVGQVPLGTLVKGIGAILAFFIPTIILVDLVGEHSGQFLKFAAGMVILSVAFGALSTLAFILGKCNPADLWKGVAVVGALMALTAMMVNIAGQTNELKTGPILALIFGVMAIVVAVAALTYFDFFEILTTTGLVMLVLASLAEVFDHMSKLKDLNGKHVATLAIVMVGMIGLAGAMFALAQQPWGQILSAGGAMVTCMIAFGAMFQMIGKIDGRTIGKNKLFAVIVAATGVLAIGVALAAVATCPWGNILAAMGGVGVCMVLFAGVCKTIGNLKANPDNVLTILAVAISFVAIGVSLMLVAQQPWNQILTAMVAIGLVVAEMAIVLGLLSNIGDPASMVAVSAAFLIFGTSLVAVAAALNMMNGVDWSAVGQLATLVGVFAALSALVAIPGFGELFAAGAIIMAVALIAFGTAVLIASAGMELFSLAMERLQYIDLLTIAQNMTTLAPALQQLATVSFGLAIAGVSMIAVAAGLAAIGLATNVTNPPLIAALSVSLMQLVQASNGLALAAAKLTLCAVALTAFGMAVAVCTALSAGLPAISAAVIGLGEALAKFAENVKKAAVALTEAGREILNFASLLKRAAIDAVNGFIQGIAASINSWLKAGMTVAKAFMDGFRLITGWGSPWTTMIESAKDAAKGFLQGNKIAEKVFKACGIDDGASFIDGLAETIESGLSSISSMLPDSIQGLLSGEGFEFDAESIFSEMIPDWESAATGADSYADSIGGIGDAAGKAKDPVKSLTDTIAHQMDIFSEFDRKTEITGEQMLKNMRSQVLGVSEWANNLQVLAARGIDQGLLQKLAELGPNGYEKVAAFVSMTDGQLQEANSLFAQSLVLPGQAAAQITNSYAMAGADASTGFANGIDPTAANSVVTQLGTNTLDTLKDTLKEHSPSRATMEMGENVVKGLTQGVKNLEHTVQNIMISLGTSCINTLKSKLTYQTFYNIGKNIGQGLTAGINNGAASVRGAVASMANAAINAAKSRFKTASPSKVFIEIGEYLDEGLAVGVSNMAGTVTSAIDSLGSKTISRFQQATDGINEFIDTDMNLNPVITPELDLENMGAEIDRFNSLFGNVQEVSAAYTYSRNATNSKELEDQNLIYQLGNKILEAAGAARTTANDMTEINLTVQLTGDAEDIFRVVQTENSRFIKATGTSPLFGAT